MDSLTWVLILAMGLPALVGLGLVIWGIAKLVKHLNKQSRVVVDSQGRIKVKVLSENGWVEQPAEEALESPSGLNPEKIVSLVLGISVVLLLVLVVFLARRVSLWIIAGLIILASIAEALFLLLKTRWSKGSK